WSGSSSIGPRFEPRRPKGAILDILERHGHHFGGAIDRDVTEELQSLARCNVLALLLAGRLHVTQLRAERVVEIVGTKTSGMDRAGDKFPERLEILEYGLVGIVIVRGRVVHVGRHPDRVANVRVLDEGQKVRDFKFTAKRGSIALGDRFNSPLAIDIIDDNQT